MIKVTTKSCPNCGANLKFGINDKITMCEYCGSQILIENKKNSENINDNTNIYVNRNWEIFKWILTIIHLPIAIFIGIICITTSNPIFGILIILGGIISIPKISELIFKKKRILKVIIIECLILIGIIGAACTIYPIKVKGKFYSESTNMTVEFKGNNIIIEDNGNTINEKYECNEEAYLYGRKIYKIKVRDYTFIYYNSDEGRKKKFYLADKYGNEIYTFYNERNKEEYDY